MPFLKVLLDHKEFIVILILLIGIFIGFEYIKSIHAQNESLEAINGTLTASLEASNKSVKTLQETIQQQNAAVDKLKTDADARVQSHAVEIAAANSKAEIYRQQALDILRVKPQDPDKCKAANNLINEEILKNVKK